MALTAIIPTTLAAGGDPLSHVLDYYPKIFGGSAEFGPFLVGISINTLTLILVTVLFVWAALKVAARVETGPAGDGNQRYVTKGRFAQVFEVIVLYLRDNVIQPQLGPDTRRFLPLLLTLFFFILFNNLIGLVPLIDLQYLITKPLLGYETKFIGGTPTGRLAVNAALALTVFLAWNWYGIKQNGFGGWLHHFTGGTPWFLWPVMIPVELMGLIVKPTALTVRLFANMTAGHVLLAVLIIFVAAIPQAIGPAGLAVSIIPLIGSVAIYMLEIFVAFLQAFIFMFLTTVFIGQMSHHGHDEHAAHDGGRDEAWKDPTPGPVAGAAM